jgi:hypothetical protein
MGKHATPQSMIFVLRTPLEATKSPGLMSLKRRLNAVNRRCSEVLETEVV